MTEAADRRVKLLAAFTRGIILELDGECRYRSVWATDERLLAMPAQQVIGRTIVDVLGEEVGRPLMEGTARVYATGTPETLEYTLAVSVGPRAFSAQVVRVPDEGPDPYRVVALIRDVTEEKDLVRKLAEAERLASFGVLAAGIGHELNNPLMVVHENARLLERTLDELAREDPSEAALAKVAAMRGMLADMLEQVRQMETVAADLRLFKRNDQPPTALGSADHSPALPRLRLLVIDDRPSLLKVLELSLSPDYDVATAPGAQAALALLARDAKFDGILCDLMMPLGDGMSFYEDLGRAHPELQRKVVFMTGGAFTPRAQAFLDAIPNPTIRKPFGPEDLRNVPSWSR